MFTGIIEETGRVRKLSRKGSTAVIEIDAVLVLSGLKHGDSIAVNGVCLTVTGFNTSCFSADVSEETLARTSLNGAYPGKLVNLERAALLGGRLGGHIVQGHVDDTGVLLESVPTGEFQQLRVSVPTQLRKYIAEKGSVTVDGISLTIAHDFGDSFIISVIPFTYKNTNLCVLKPGDRVNLEIDVLARYLEKLLNYDSKEDRLKKLLENM